MVAEKIKARLVLGELNIERIEAPCPIFKDYCESWLEGYIKPTKRRTTYHRYSSLLNKHIGPKIGKKPISAPGPPLTVGLVIDAKGHDTHLESFEFPFGPQLKPGLRFMIGFSEW